MKSTILIKIVESDGRLFSTNLAKFQKNEILIGTSESADIQVQDPSLFGKKFRLTLNDKLQDSFRFQSCQTDTPFLIQDIWSYDSHFSTGIKLRFGNCKIELKNKISDILAFNESPWITQDPRGLAVLRHCLVASQNLLSTYLSGPTGVGKDLLAKWIHSKSAQSENKFVAINCACLSGQLTDSELFGHKIGSFTGASKNRLGALSLANQGTLFLDEIGELSLEVQSKLLRFLENGEIRPLGSDQCVHSKVRLICATHLPLEEMVSTGKFRKDLYYRIASVRISIPSLAERRIDIAILSKHFAHLQNKEISIPALQLLKSMNWEGNVRELKTGIQRAISVCGTKRTVLTTQDFEFLSSMPIKPPLQNSNKVQKLKECERELIISALHSTRGNRKKAAEALGIARSTIFQKIKQYRLKDFRIPADF